MWGYLTIIDKKNNITHETIMFDTDEFEFTVHNEDKSVEYFNSANIIETINSEKEETKEEKEE